MRAYTARSWACFSASELACPPDGPTSPRSSSSRMSASDFAASFGDGRRSMTEQLSELISLAPEPVIVFRRESKLLIRRLHRLQSTRFSGVPEAPEILAGGEASLRAGTTGSWHKQTTAPRQGREKRAEP